MEGGKKNDSGKLRYDLIPAYPLERLTAVYTMGAQKYGDWNWRKGFKYSRLYAAMMRHIQNWWTGTKIDPDGGQLVLASVAWCAFALMEFDRYGIGIDDRPHNLVQTTVPEWLEEEEGLLEGSHEEWLEQLDAVAVEQTQRDQGRK